MGPFNSAHHWSKKLDVILKFDTEVVAIFLGIVVLTGKSSVKAAVEITVTICNFLQAILAQS